ncbi:hypothetical protein [Massilia sp. 9096]|uniref:hypothetical protein n=1 Tax=Massilia sp. 9096 TaxID=1500894 RepID=UPI00056D88E4|nr:hypothetical protein [Massilia sp. 9096]
MIYVSLPVHTRPGVIAGQLANFAAFLPDARVVLHVSANARCALHELERVLAGAGCTNAAINGLRLRTDWGDILPAHLANLDWIRRHAPQCTRICLHASNDMLVRPGLGRYLACEGNFLHQRPIRPGSRWRFAKAALADAALQALCRRLGEVPAPLVGSQVEGSSYEAGLLYEVAAILGSAARAAAPVAYPREEVWLSTVAHARGARVAGTPYVFSEVHRFDRSFWRVLRIVDPLIGRPGDARYLPRRALEFLMIRSGFHRIDRRLVDLIAADAADTLAPHEWLSDDPHGASRWRVFDRHGLYGVKRVPRRPGHRLRRYIDQLSEQLSEQLSKLPGEQRSDSPAAGVALPIRPPDPRLAHPSHEDR